MIGPHTMIDLFMFALQILLAAIGWKIKADVSNMKAHMYEHFLTKKDFSDLWRDQNSRLADRRLHK